MWTRLRDWMKYGHLVRYPALKAFDRDEALARLKAYHKEEVRALQPWLTIVYVGTFVVMMIALVASIGSPIFFLLLLVFNGLSFGIQYFVHRRVRRRVAARVAAELRNGRPSQCLECGYDLRESPERCLECGKAIGRLPEGVSSVDGPEDCRPRPVL